MHETNRDGLDRHSDDVGFKVATERVPAISGLAIRTFQSLVRRARS
jgi:hypothetical protein